MQHSYRPKIHEEHFDDEHLRQDIGAERDENHSNASKENPQRKKSTSSYEVVEYSCELGSSNRRKTARDCGVSNYTRCFVRRDVEVARVFDEKSEEHTLPGQQNHLRDMEKKEAHEVNSTHILPELHPAYSFVSGLACLGRKQWVGEGGLLEIPNESEYSHY